MVGALIDNATLNSAGNLFLKPKNGYRGREINVQSLDSFLEAYILNDQLFVEPRFWDHFINNVPEVGRDQFKGIVFPTQLNLSPVIGLNEFLESEMVFFLLNVFCQSNKELSVYTDFLSYTGQDFGNFKNADGNYDGDWYDSIYLQVEQKLKEKWDWEYYSANIDHIDAVIMAWRTLNYIQIAEDKGLNLIAHEIRNYFISQIGYAYDLKIPQQENFTLYKKIAIDLQEINEAHYVKDILGKKAQGEIVWDTVHMPFLPALIYENARGIGEIFFLAEQWRRKFEPYRNIITEFDRRLVAKDTVGANQIQAEINQFLHTIETSLTTPNIEWSFSVGFPLSFSAGVAKKATAPRYLKVFKHLLYRYALPRSYTESCQRLFGQIRWNSSLSDPEQ